MGTSKITLKNSDKLNFLSNLSTMISSGIPILETIDSLLEDSKGNMKKMLEIIREDILQGNHLYSSFGKFPDIFNKVTVNVIRASEEAGTLDVTLKDIRSQLEKEIEFQDKIRSAMIYPIFIILVFFGVMIMMLVVVMPKISSVFSRLNVDLPLPTRIMIGMSDIVTKYTLPLLAGLIVLVIFMVLIFKAQRKVILGGIYKLPLISTLVKEIDLAHFSRSMFLLLSSGITITNALDLAQEVVMRKDIAKAVEHAKETVLAGRQLSQAFKDNKEIFSGIVIKLVEAGEKTGTLDKSLQDVSKQMDYQVNNTLDTLTAMIEPIMLVVVGLLVGGMMLAIIAPIYGLIGQIGPR